MNYINKTLIFIIMFSFASYANAQNKESSPKAKLLIEYYEKANNQTSSKKYCTLFFETYPDTWNEFHSFYGYHKNNKNYGYLGGQVDVLYFFETIKCIEKKTFYTKLINVSVGGEWEADYTGAFQRELHKYMLKEPNLAISILNDMEDKRVIDFFYFFYYSIHPRFKWIPEELELATKNNHRISKLMKAGFNKAIKNSNHH